MIKDITIFYDEIVFLLSNASIKYFEIFFNADGDFEFINAINLCMEFVFKIICVLIFKLNK